MYTMHTLYTLIKEGMYFCLAYSSRFPSRVFNISCVRKGVTLDPNDPLYICRNVYSFML